MDFIFSIINRLTAFKKSAIITGAALLAATLVFGGDFAHLAAPFLLLFVFFVIFMPKNADFTNMLIELSSLINIRYNLIDALNTLTALQPVRKKALTRIAQDMENGSTFSQACLRRRVFFPPMFCRMASIGEEKGLLPEFLNVAVEYYQRELSLTRMKYNTFAYPVFVFIAGVAASGMLMVVVIPMFAAMFADSGGTLPLMTRLTIVLSKLGTTVLPWLMLAAVVLAVIKKRKTQRGFFRPVRDRLDLYLLALVVRTCLAGGVRIEDALSSAANVLGYLDVQAAVDRISRKMRNGVSLSEAVKGERALPEDFADALVSGAAAGDVQDGLDRLLSLMRDQEDIQLEQKFRRWGLIAVFGTCMVVGWIIISMYLPVLRLASTLSD